jgi:hypothetical protein
MRKLDSYLETEYKYISTRKNERNIEGIHTASYLFEDINGLQFSVVAFPVFGDYDSSQPGYPRCNYLTSYYEFNKEPVEEALQCGLPVTSINSGMYTVFRLKISDYDELDILASALEKALNTFEPLISENYLGKTSEEFEFYTPEIAIYTDDEKQIISVFDFRLIKGQAPWTREEIFDKLSEDYKKNR